jgi:hypothetical protein
MSMNNNDMRFVRFWSFALVAVSALLLMSGLLWPTPVTGLGWPCLIAGIAILVWARPRYKRGRR